MFPASFKVSLPGDHAVPGEDYQLLICGRSDLALFPQGFWPLVEDLVSLVTTRPAWQIVVFRARQAVASKDRANFVCEDVKHATVHAALKHR